MRPASRLPTTVRPPPLPPGGGLLLVDKPSGCTSHDVVGRLRKVLRTRRIGHAGTLDPMATGLLVLAVDRSTKLLGHLALTDKTYLGDHPARVSRPTPTTPTARSSRWPTRPRSPPSRRRHPRRGGGADRAAAAGAQFGVGDQGRRPARLRPGPRGGARSSWRRGRSPCPGSRSSGHRGAARRAGRRHRSSMSRWSARPGTYVRSLARDLGAALGVGGHLTRLRRTRVGPFDRRPAVDVFGRPTAR